MRRARRALLVGVAALVVGAGPTACGIPIDDAPAPVDLPPQYQPTTSTATPESATTGTALTAMLCLTRDQELVRVSRPVETPHSPSDLLTDLMKGATEREQQEQGLDSALTGIRGLSVTVANGVADVAVGDGLDAITASTRLLILGQIVCTLDAHPDIDGVWFNHDGQRLTVPRGDGQSTDGVLTAEDYEMPPTASSTATPGP